MRKSFFAICSVLLILLVSIAVFVPGCDGGDTYTLTMEENPAGTGTATDETGESPYEAGDVVDIKAVPADCYRFTGWSAPDGEFGNSTAAETTFAMPVRDVIVTANFELTPADHYKFYWVDEETAPDAGKEVQLVDQFGTFNATVGEAWAFGNPVEKVHDDVTPIADENRHYTLYELDYGEEEPMLDSWQVTISNQFGDNQELTVWGPVALAVPTEKLEADLEAPVCLDHLLVYEANPSSWLEEPIAVVDLHDQFQDQPAAEVWDPVYFATPVEKTLLPGGSATPKEHEDEHMVFYYIDGAPFEKKVQIDNQFGEQTLDLIFRDTLAVPSEKISVEQPLSHFKCYWGTWAEAPPTTFPAEVQLEDQLIADWLDESLNATVLDPWLFANPVEKTRILGEEEFEWTPVSNWNNHLTFYNIIYVEGPQVWEVTVNNQFGNEQLLLIAGPFYLAVPTQKGDQDPTADLDHFLVYDVIDYDYLYPEAQVYLWDQFTEQHAWVYPPYKPGYFAVPVQKTYKGEVTERVNPTEHLVFYGITGGEFDTVVPVDNQFGPQLLYVWQSFEDLLGVPSEKIDWEWLGAY
jgi:hypothetical protein